MIHIATELPPGLTCYRQTQEFTRHTVPAALLAAHNTKAGVWGLLRVLNGRVRYCLEEDTNSSLVVEAGGSAVIEPEARHHVELLDEGSAFLVEFHRAQAVP